LNKHEAQEFALRVYESVLGKKAETTRVSYIKEVIHDIPRPLLAHSEVAGVVYKLIKVNGWFSK
jgi:hypothetical protein